MAAERAGTKIEKKVQDADWIESRMDAFVNDIIHEGKLDQALIVGIFRRGAALAARVRTKIEAKTGTHVPLGGLNIALYRDDAGIRGPQLGEADEATNFESEIDNRVIYLVDDVLFTGRTIRAAMDVITDFGRPGVVKLYSLIDRGGRELPIQPDKVGQRLTVPLPDRIDVRLKEVDGDEGVYTVVGGMR